MRTTITSRHTRPFDLGFPVFLAFISALLLLSVGARSAVAAEKCTRTEVTTDRFRLLTALSPERAVPIAEALNRFQSAIEVVMAIKQPTPAVPTNIYVLTDGDWSFVANGAFYSGFFRELPFRNEIIVQAPPDKALSPYMLVMNAYAHYLLSGQRGFLYPLWYRIGLGEILGTAIEDDTSFQLGLIRDDTRAEVTLAPRLLPFDKLLLMDPRLEKGYDYRYEPAFHGESALLVHYLMFGSPARKEQLNLYLGALSRGVPSARAFEESFHTQPAQLEKEVRAYARQKEFSSIRLPRSALAPKSVPVANGVPCSPADTEMAHVLLSMGANPYDISGRWIGEGDKNEADWRLVKAEAALARKDKSWEIANRYFDQALQLPQVSARDELLAAEILFAQVSSPLRPDRKLTELERTSVERASALLRKPEVLKLDDPQVVFMRGVIAVLTNTDVDAALESLFQALEKRPTNPYLAEVAGILCDRKHDLENAAGAWSIVAAYGRNPEKRASGAEKLKAIDAAAKARPSR